VSLTPTEQRKAREAEQRRKAIIKIVRKLIRKGGMGEISLRKVAELAGYSTTVVYTLFGDKAALITQAMDEDLLELTRTITQAVEQAEPGWPRLRAMGRAYVKFGIDHPDEYAFVFMTRRPHAPNEAARVQHGNPAQDPYAAGRLLVSEAARMGLLSDRPQDIELMVQILWEGIHGLTARLLVMGEDDNWVPSMPTDLHLEAMLDVLCAGLAHRFPPRRG
jgi:AcrR family transcriptional regulator